MRHSDDEAVALAETQEPPHEFLHVDRLRRELHCRAPRSHIVGLDQDSLATKSLSSHLAHANDAEELPPIDRPPPLSVREGEHRLLSGAIEPEHLACAPVAGVGPGKDRLGSHWCDLEWG